MIIKLKNLNKLYDAINYTSSIKFMVNSEALDFINDHKEIIFKDYYANDGLSL